MPKGLAAALYLGVATTAIAYALFAVGVARLGAPAAVTISPLEPVKAAVLGAVGPSQKPAAPNWAGLLLVLAGLALMMRPCPRGERPMVTDASGP